MIEEIKKDLLKNISKDRYKHTLRVVETCEKLARAHGGDLEKVKLAALLHDSAKFTSKEKVYKRAQELCILDKDILYKNKELIHAPLAAKLAEENYGIEDKDVLNAIKFHTTGRKNMSLLEKIVFMGDYIEPSRKFEGIEEIRELAFKDLNRSLFLALNTNLEFLIEKEKLISIDSIEARNYLLSKFIKEGDE